MSTELVSKHVLKVPERLVAPVEKQNVPNHLLNTKIYARLERNDLFEVTPVEVHFSGFEVGESKSDAKKYTQKLRIINISDQVQRMTVLPPQTKYFDVFYVKPDRLVPGFALEIQVIFKPDAYRYYTDAIRIHSKGEENLIIPIHAYPIISSFDFPTEYKFPNVAIGNSITRSFSIRSTAPIEFEFMIDILQKHPAFEVDPLEGVIPFNDDAIINITFTPKEFCTAIMIIQLIVSQFNAKPIICKFYGTCNPGLARDKVLTAITVDNNLNDENELVDPRVLTPLHLSRLKRRNSADLKSDFSNSISKGKQNRYHFDSNESTADGTVEIDGYRFPKELNTVWGVSKFLNQTKGKLRLKDLRAQANATNQVSKQQKETLFVQKVLELEDEERRNQLKWQVKLGETSIDHQSKQEILISRAQAEHQYKLAMGLPVFDEELSRRVNLLRNYRTSRPYNQVGKTDIKFDVFKNELWSLRHLAANKFIEGARKIIILNRLKKVLNALKAFSSEWIYAKTSSTKADYVLSLEGFVEQYEKKLKGENIEQDVAVTSLTSRTLGTFYFPQAVDSNDSQSDANLDSLGPVAVKSIEFAMKTETPYVNLAVPKYYTLNNYKLIADSQYVPKYENRINKLRKGAEDELIQVDIKTVATVKNSTVVLDKKPTEKTSEFMKSSSSLSENIKESKGMSPESEQASTMSQGPQVIDVEVPEYLTEPIQYPPMHIFNPAPGLVSYQKLLPYSGNELNHHLNPLPRFEKDQPFTAQKKYIDRDDVIKGVMSWKKFPSQGLISLSNTPTLTDVWVPRWSNVFGSDLMPIETPPLLAGLPADDKENLLMDQDDEPSDAKKEPLVTLTPEMVNAQFNIPSIFENRQQNLKDEIAFPYSDKLPATNLPVSTDGPVPREQREQELEYFLNKQYNELGLRLKSKLNIIQSGNEASVIALEPQATVTTPPEQEQQKQEQNTAEK